MSRDSRDVDSVQQRARRYWYDDGLTEIAAGCIFVLVGLLFFVEALAPSGSLPVSFSAIALPTLIIVGIWAAGVAVKAAKERITYPRTGYVSYRRRKGTYRFITGLVAGAMGALVAGLLRSWPSSLAWIPALQGLAIAGFLLYIAHTLGLVRFYALAIFSLLVGGVASFAGLGETLGSTAYFAAFGVALILSGGLTLKTYLSRTQPPMGD